MLLAVLFILLKSDSWPSILFMVPIFLAPLATSSHLVLVCIPHLVSFLGVVSFWALTYTGSLACRILAPLHRYYLLTTTTLAVVEMLAYADNFGFLRDDRSRLMLISACCSSSHQSCMWKSLLTVHSMDTK